ncbi:MAG TPA: hypothetical protein VF721_08380 [Pyrinomonadaceae bacterium]
MESKSEVASRQSGVARRERRIESKNIERTMADCFYLQFMIYDSQF